MSTTSTNIVTKTDNSSKISWAGHYELTKPRLSLLSVITALVGYLAALPSKDFGILFNFSIGTALCAAGAATLNQWLEKKEDSIMERTKDRPLPAGLVSPHVALLQGIIISIVGVLQLGLGVNTLTGALGAATILSYVVIYTPMKKMTRWATELGAISGALPPLIGWAAAENGISALGWILFGILTFWQLPHFMAIAWSFRHDYEKAGFPMLSVLDKTGNKVARWSMINAIALFIVSLLPVAMGFSGWLYGSIATIFGLWLLKRAYEFMKEDQRDIMAKKLFFNSIIYLPAVLFTLVIDRWLVS
ncbi:heme o synthase [Puniceicoccaceae bacterium K14]|nr:heme o synthase [Puniceicoccaceae bacterium K14]